MISSMEPRRRTSRFTRTRLLLALVVLMPLASCGNKRLVEVFDNGPVGGPQGPSEGYIWVGKNDNPPPGKTWAPVDENTLTPQQKKRIRH